ncbi:MAG: bifunctional phosphopantothenoylcysteine decarboxylase/phosphopantothenate--cysteine ligase CoaBC [Ignavibacteriota bacterium]|nr:MAG: bifunctional phosphopantothenoylcysteine decarboxylase/phosphopantothenate--cysteine ligase CoaBC [Chlorobiota bacterium]MBE7476474.1 bifunctional phosphopantothenoylcysteine decarboxylase/phosphopantothenate--cysteine ligase CoaBC [Ignavibacteriales bacterium]MBL1123609.1 bifunctional phosphopantothenoylcysteine decarboxylase/phosphopantothenate--cysteine ligase CoaBC [Ignavibacteriota bacterium]MCE7855534.1 bifunctional phosphopantothenoylcysteine decarboxylase/phosphopantothenate--cys
MTKDILSGKKVLLGITGCIAAYKSCLIIRELIKRGAEVKVVMTPSATEFISPLTISSLSNNEVIVNTFPKNQKDGTNVSTWHIDYALWADLMLLAPATINTIAKISYGFADNALTTLVTALRSPLIIAPAADVDMYNNPINKENLEKLERHGHYIIYPETGELASGLTGEGRLADTNKIIEAVELILSGYSKDLIGKKILISAGPTYEDIDPVRFIGNRSSGKLGYAIAKAAFLRGGDVTLVSGPSSQNIYPEIKTLKVRSAVEMEKAVKKEIDKNNLLVMSAAVADFRPSKTSSNKIKKGIGSLDLKLEMNVDILSSIKSRKTKVVGFALETQNELSNAQKKLKEKNLDMIVLNSPGKESGFEVDTNKVTIIKQDGKQIKLPLLSKFQVANKILNEIKTIL